MLAHDLPGDRAAEARSLGLDATTRRRPSRRPAASPGRRRRPCPDRSSRLAMRSAGAQEPSALRRTRFSEEGSPGLDYTPRRRLPARRPSRGTPRRTASCPAPATGPSARRTTWLVSLSVRTAACWLVGGALPTRRPVRDRDAAVARVDGDRAVGRPRRSPSELARMPEPAVATARRVHEAVARAAVPSPRRPALPAARR